MLNIDKTWTLFLDRDGVINLHYPNDYVKKWDEFVFLEGTLDAIRELSHIFRRIIIVTNQQGVGKGIMTQADLDFIHDEMLKEVRKHGGKVNAIYAATDLVAADTKQMRKPQTGMAKQAKRDFPEIDFEKAMMVGDSISDMEFGKNAGMKTIYVGHHYDEMTDEHKGLIDMRFGSLVEFALKIGEER